MGLVSIRFSIVCAHPKGDVYFCCVILLTTHNHTYLLA